MPSSAANTIAANQAVAHQAAAHQAAAHQAVTHQAVANQAAPKSRVKWPITGSTIAFSAVSLTFTIVFGAWGIKSYNAANLANELSQKESCRQHPVSRTRKIPGV
jgi:hypothetical protein